MREFHTRRRVAHSADDMFALVADVERYPEFLPLCRVLHVRERTSEGAADVLIATMTVAYKLVRESFTTRVTLRPAERRIMVEYLDGPFRHLENRWHFDPVDPAHCEVDFYIAYEFRSRTLQLLMGSVFDAAFGRFTDAFQKRADFVYGTIRRQGVTAP